MPEVQKPREAPADIKERVSAHHKAVEAHRETYKTATEPADQILLVELATPLAQRDAALEAALATRDLLLAKATTVEEAEAAKTAYREALVQIDEDYALATKTPREAHDAVVQAAKAKLDADSYQSWLDVWGEGKAAVPVPVVDPVKAGGKK